jgi:RNA polymerase sigma-70 factor (ECF subfamily)
MLETVHDDAADVAASRRGDDDAFRRLVESYQNDIAGLMSRFTRDQGQLEELVQDVFVDAWKSLSSFEEGRRFCPWLRTIAVHTGYRYWKSLARRRQDVSLDDIGQIAAAPDRVSPERAEEILHELFARLRQRDRLILMLVYQQGCSIAEASELTGWSKVMVKVQAHRARARLKRLLHEVMSERAVPT